MRPTVPKPKLSNGRPLPLENGDQLTAPEFLRRYQAMPHIKKAELIEGIVYMGSPVRYASHGRPDLLIQGWVFSYEASTPGVEAVSNTTIQLDIDNVPQPDTLLRLPEECGGQSRIDEKDYLEGAPELVVEIAASSASIDTREKLRAYRRNGVQEYLLWLVDDKIIRCLRLEAGEYVLAKLDQTIFRSQVFPGLWLDLDAALALRTESVLRTLQTGLKSRAHQQFVAKLAASKSARGKEA